MQTHETTFRLDDARAPLWFGVNAGWDDAVRAVDPRATRSAEAMITAAGLGWTVEQHPLEAVIDRGASTQRVPVPKHVANVLQVLGKRRKLLQIEESPLTDSNRRPPPYHGGALPTELRGREGLL
jgi:hypothetical protein